AQAADVRQFVKSGDDLIVHLTDGRSFVIEDFFVKGPNGEVSRLLYEDGTFSGVDGNVQTVEGDAVGLGAAMSNEDMAAIAIAGLGGLGLIASSG
ncbi:BapA prefix-like domain-containing protein, partial [Rhodobacter sp. SGA-6-6]|uniref:BapA prefix-like domain-containing protein n=1 Tax=Rhodobacter sp. SGA-6-6 TaxID=2710882 RepID=UPI0013EB3A00